MKFLKRHLIYSLLILFLSGCKNDKNMDEIKNNNYSVEKLWNEFIDKNPNNKFKDTPTSFYFCDNKKDANECAELVVNNIKKATATSLWWYEKNNEPLPQIGDQYVVTDWSGNAKAIIEVTKVVKTPYNQITSEFAKTEGEGDKSLSYWKKVHKAYYSREMKPFNETFDENMIIVCEYFKTVYLK
jgi:uncharacterized protein YhfF